jgi:hypothetical protein
MLRKLNQDFYEAMITSRVYSTDMDSPDFRVYFTLVVCQKTNFIF